MYHRHVIPINVSWSVNFNAHHLQLIPDAAQRLNTLIYGNKLSSKNSALDNGLYLGMPLYNEHVHKNHITSTGTTILLIPGMFGINKHYELNFLTKMFRNIIMLCLFDIYV